MGNEIKSEKASNIQNHERFGQIKVEETVDGYGQTLSWMTLSMSMESQKQFNKWKKQFDKIDDTLSKQVLLLPTLTIYQSTGMCGSSGLVHLKYQYFPYVFQIQIENRRRINRLFIQTQLWYLFYNLIRAGSIFQKYNTKIGDVHPSNILINNDGLVKFISTRSLPRQQTNFDKYIQNSHSKVYLAPEQLQGLTESSNYPKNINPSAAECFSIGLTMLAAATLQNVDAIYQNVQGKRTISRFRINQLLQIVGQKYSSLLQSHISSLLNPQPQLRKTCSQLYNSLRQYEQKILDLQPFMPTNSRMVFRPQPRVFQSQGNGRYPQIHSKAQATNIYFNPNQNNNVIINPIESKYIPQSTYNNNFIQFNRPQSQNISYQHVRNNNFQRT